MRKIYFFGMGIALLCLAGLAVYQFHKPHRNAADETTAASVTASALYHAFEAGENDATKKWVGKIIEVQGDVASVSEAGNYISVNLRGNGAGDVNCSVRKSDLPDKEKPAIGQTIIIKGRCSGFLMDVNLVDCIVKTTEK